MSRLAFEAVCPTPIEKQRVGTCLRVFCDETISALMVQNPEIQDASGTIYFLTFVLEFWKIVDVYSKFTAQKTLDNLKAVITSPYGTSIQKLKSFNTFIQNMHCTGGEKNENFDKRHTCLFVANRQWLG